MSIIINSNFLRGVKMVGGQRPPTILTPLIEKFTQLLAISQLELSKYLCHCSFFLFLAVLSAGPLLSQSTVMDQLKVLDQEIKDSLQFNGSLLVADGDHILWQSHSGLANRELQVPVNANTKFRIASISKMMVSYAIYVLKSQKIIDLEQKIGEFLPELKPEIREKVRVEDLLLHRAGLIRDVKLVSEKSASDFISEEEILRLLNQTDLMFAPGTARSYSNVGYTLLGMLLARVNNSSFDQAIKDILLDPLKMKNTGHEVFDQIIEHRASGYDRVGSKVWKAKHEDKSWVLGAGSIYSTAADLLKFSLEVQKGSLLTTESHQEYLKDLGNFQTSGGWVTWTYRSKFADGPQEGQVLMHGGSCPGFRSSLTIFLEHGISVIALSNEAPMESSLLYNKLGNIALGFPKEDLYVPNVQKILPLVMAGDLEKANEVYQMQLEALPNNEKIKPAQLNDYGYMLAEHKQIEPALNVFYFAIQLFPNNANAYDSLGEALIQAGRIEEGISMYKRSLELQAENEGARQMIKKYSGKN